MPYLNRREEVIGAIASDYAIALFHRIEYLRRIDEGMDPEEVLREFKAFVLEGIENQPEFMGG